MVLLVDGVEFAYRSAPVLRDVSFTVDPGAFWVVLGNNGAGKSTLLRCVNRILKPSKGAVMIDGQDARSLSRMELARRLGHVPQRTENPRITVFDAVLLGRRPHIEWSAQRRDFEVVERVLGQLGLDALAMRHLDELSGGELQKTAIARALAQEPRVLLLDEPTASLDLRNQLEVLRTVKRVTAEEGVAVLAVMHDVNLALRFGDGFMLLSEGRLLACGGPEIITPANIAHVYGVAVMVTSVGGVPLVVPVEAASACADSAPAGHARHASVGQKVALAEA